MDPVSCFVKDGIYKLKSVGSEIIFLCTSCAESSLGKLCQYKIEEDGTYLYTGITYFLNYYQEDDVKSIFLNRYNYEMVGILGINYLQQDINKLVKKG